MSPPSISHLETNQLESAIALCQGDLLPGFSCDSLPFDEWLRSERENLHRSEVIYAEAGTARRRMLHRRAFEALREMAAPDSQLAHHALKAGLVAETIRYSLVAGNEAMALFAVRVAITHYETAWQVTEKKGGQRKYLAQTGKHCIAAWGEPANWSRNGRRQKRPTRR